MGHTCPEAVAESKTSSSDRFPIPVEAAVGGGAVVFVLCIGIIYCRVKQVEKDQSEAATPLVV